MRLDRPRRLVLEVRLRGVLSPDSLRHLAPIIEIECDHVVYELLPSPGIGLLIRVGQDEGWLLHARVRLDAGPVRRVLDLDRAFCGLEERSIAALLLARSTAAAPVGVMMSRNLSTPRSSEFARWRIWISSLNIGRISTTEPTYPETVEAHAVVNIVQLLYGLVPVRDDVARVDCTSSV